MDRSHPAVVDVTMLICDPVTSAEFAVAAAAAEMDDAPAVAAVPQRSVVPHDQWGYHKYGADNG